MPYCYLNGQLLPVAQAQVGVYDIGLLRGFGIYEALVCRQGKPFRFADHMARFRRSAAELNISIPATDEAIAAAIGELLVRNELTEAIVRLILTGGTASGGIEYDPAAPTFYILMEPFVPLEERYVTEGCALLLFEHERQFPRLKTTNYIQAVVLQAARKAAGALEVLYTAQGRVLEAATSNFFIVRGGTVVTPQAGILEGITRKVTLELAREHYPVEERDLTLKEAYGADEAFITSSFKDIVPVVRVGERQVGSGRPGPVTQELMRLFAEYVHAS